ncbi:TetR/AcrR family transcriptional regulator [Mycobacterium sp. NPDC003323]
MRTEIGRPRDPHIDAAVLRATVELIGQTSYADLTVGAIAARAGTSKPAIYRRWPTKAALVHEAVFPLGEGTELPVSGVVFDDVRQMLRRTLAVLSTPAARAALPGLIAEMAADPALHAALLVRFGDILERDLGTYLASAVARKEVRAGVTATDLAESIAGITLLAVLTRGTAPDDGWLERTTTLIVRGISA